MATQARGLRKQNSFISEGECFASGTQKGVKLSGRKALTDVTNSGKPSLHLATKNSHPKDLTAAGGSVNLSKPLFSVGKMRGVSKVQQKVGVGGRKALTDVTNSGEPSTHQTAERKESKRLNVDGGHSSSVGVKTHDCKAKGEAELGCRKVLSDIGNLSKPSLHQTLKKTYSNKLDVIAEEQWLHDHQECINSQRKAIDLNLLSMMTTGLDAELSTEIKSPGGQSKVGSPLRYPELEAIAGLLDECLSPLQCWNWTPKSLKTSICQTGYASPDLKLKTTPKLSN